MEFVYCDECKADVLVDELPKGAVDRNGTVLDKETYKVFFIRSHKRHLHSNYEILKQEIEFALGKRGYNKNKIANISSILAKLIINGKTFPNSFFTFCNKESKLIKEETENIYKE